eukprot:gene2737-3399_t
MIKTLGQVKQLLKDIDTYESRIGPTACTVNAFEQTYNSIQKLIQLQNSFKKQDTSTVKVDENLAIETFKVWLTKNGFDESKSKVKIARGLNEGIGLVATSEIKEGEVFLEVPPNLFLTQEMAVKALSTSFKSKDDIFSHVPSLMLSVYLIYELNKKQSFWMPYLQVLPKTYKTVLFLTIDELRQLEGTSIGDEALNVYRSTIRQYSYLYEYFGSNPGFLSTTEFTWENFMWAVSAVMSRQNPVPITDTKNYGAGTQYALIPMWDFCNHTQSGAISTFYDAGLKVLTAAAIKNHKVGDQVYIHYGDRPNTQLLLYQGFSVKNNQMDTLKLALELAKDDPLRHDKIHILEDRGLSSPYTINLPTNPTSLHDAVIPFYRVYCMNEELVKKETTNNPGLHQHGHHHHDRSSCGHGHQMTEKTFTIINEDNENQSYKTLLSILKSKLDLSPTTLEQDEQLLSKNPPGFIRYILYARISEKKILVRTIKLVESLIQKGVMTLPQPQIKKEEPHDHSGHGHSHGSHGHSHGGHGHSHGGHGHSHGSGEEECSHDHHEEESHDHSGHGHSHGGHGHSHGGGHGHSHGGHGHSH